MIAHVPFSLQYANYDYGEFYDYNEEAVTTDAPPTEGAKAEVTLSTVIDIIAVTINNTFTPYTYLMSCCLSLTIVYYLLTSRLCCPPLYQHVLILASFIIELFS